MQDIDTRRDRAWEQARAGVVCAACTSETQREAFAELRAKVESTGDEALWDAVEREAERFADDHIAARCSDFYPKRVEANPTITRVREELLSGRTFHLHAMSARSRFGYEPPIGRRDWAHAMREVAAMANESGALAQVAANIRVNLYGTASQAQAAVWDGIAEAVGRGYDDVIGRSGPEGGRFAPRDFTLAERLQLVAWGEAIAAPFAGHVPGVGWAVQAIAEREGVRLPGLRERVI